MHFYYNNIVGLLLGALHSTHKTQVQNLVEYVFGVCVCVFWSKIRNILEKEQVQEKDERSPPLNTKNNTKDLNTRRTIHIDNNKSPQDSNSLIVIHLF